jgi:large repetitive protein
MRKTTLSFLVMFIFCSLSSFGQVWSEGFESGIPATWQRFTLLNGAPGTVPAWENATGNACEGTGSAFVSNALIGAGNTTAAWLVTPQVTIPANAELSFKGVQTYPAQNGSIYQLWVSTTSQTDVSTFTMIKSWTENEMNPGNQIACYTQVVNLNAYAGQNLYMAFVKRDTQYATVLQGDRFRLDDIKLSALCLPPTSASVSATGTDNADIAIVGTTPGTWQINLLPGTNTANTGVVTHSGAATPVHVTGLSGSTPYTFYVRSSCGNNSYSNWIGPYNFTTLQASTTMPFTDNFDSDAIGWTFTTGTQINKWNVGSATSASAPRSLYISDDSGTTNNYTITQTSTVHAYRDIQIPATATNVGISFDWKGMGEVNDFFYVWAVPATYPLTAGTVITPLANSRILIGSAFYNSANFQNYSYMLNATPFAGQTMRLVFEWRNNSFTGTQPPAAIDNVSVREVSCVVPTTITYAGVTSTTATINWIEAGTATAWDVLVRPMGSPFPNANATGYAEVTGTPTYNATNLVASSGYDVYVRSVCSSTNKSFWVRATPRLTTACGIIVPPFTETFNSTSPSEACWTVVDANADNLTWNLNTTYFMYEGDQAASITKYWNSTSNNDWLISPQIQLNGNQRLKFRYRIVSAAYPTDLEVLLSTSGSAPANFTNVLMPQQTIINPVYEQKIIYLNNYTGVVNLALHVPNVATNSWTLFIDEVIVEDIPPCAAPSGLTASNYNNTSATLSWTQGFQESDWEVKVQPVNSGVPTTNGVVVPDPTYNAQGLNPATQYEYYVRAVCSDANKSEWVGPFVFNTIVCPVENRCNYKVTVTATTGNGTFSRLNFYQNGILVGTVSALSGLVNTGTVAMCPDIPFTVNWDYASWSTYTADVHIQDSYDETVYRYIKDVTPVVLPITVPVYSGVGTCTPVACPKPQSVVSAGSSTTSVTVDWTEPGSATSWEVFAVPTGQPGPGSTTLGVVVTQHPYTIENLTPGMRYSIYVRSVCSETSKSTWTIEKVLSTNITNDNCDTAYILPVSATGYCESPYHATLNMATASSQGNTCGIAAYANDDVWFQFTATATSHIMYINNRAGSNTNLNLSKVLYSGDCNNLQQVLCTQGANIQYNTTYFITGPGANNNDVLLNNLTVGTTYKIRIFSNYATANDVRFDICIGTPSRALAIDETTYTPEQLITDVLIDENCAQATNINYSTGTNYGAPHNGIAYFNRNGSDFPFERGIILSTGKATNASGSKTTMQSVTYAQTVSPYNTLWLGDQDLYNYIISTGTAQGLNNFYNASSIEFDFMAYGNEMSFDFLFASEDYGLFQCNWGDAFAFFLTDDQGNSTNLAVVPNTTAPVSVTTIRDSRYNYDTNTCASNNPEYFDKLYDGYKGYSRYAAPANFLGNTVPMTVRSAVVPGAHYHIKMVIAEKNDGNYDSAIFLDGDSFNVGKINLGADLLVSTNTALCHGTQKVLDTRLSSDYFTFVWKNGADIIDGATGSTYTVTEPGTYSVTATVITSGCTTTDSVIVEFNENISAVVNAPADLTVCSATAQGEFNLDQNTTAILNNVATAADYEVSYYETLTFAQSGTDANAITGTAAYQAVNNHTVYVRVENIATGCYTTFTFNTLVTPNTIAETGFTYAAGSCELGTTNPAPVKNTGFTEGGTYSVTDSNITIDPATGVVDLSQSAPGTYVVRYTVASANCLTGDFHETNITINAATAAAVTFSYTAACELDAMASPVLPTGFTTGGTFSSTTLTVNATSGVVDLAGVTPGTYPVVYNVAADAANCLAAGTYTADVTVNAPTAAAVTFSYASVCALGTTASPVLPTGFTTGGTFSSTDVTVNATSGVVDVTGVSAGTYQVTYTVTADATNCIAGDSYTANIIVTAPTAVSTNFSYNSVCALNTSAAPILPTGFTTGGTFSSALTVNATSGVVDLTGVASGTYQVTYTVTADATNCIAGDSYTANIIVTAPTAVSTNFSYNSVCALNTSAAPILSTGFTTGGTFSSTDVTVNATSGVVDVTGVSAGTYQVTYTVTADATNCIAGDSYTADIVVTTPSAVATSFSYNSICALSTTAAPILPTGFTTGGTFASTDVTVNATSGVVDLTGVASGTYQVTYTVTADATNCIAGDSYTANIIVTAPTAVSTSFSYNSVCALNTSAAPILPTGFTTGGTFSSALTVNATSGVVDVTGVSAGTYQVTYTVTADATNCIAGDSYTANIVVTTPSAVSTNFSYNSVCALNTSAAPILPTGFTTGGTFSSALTVNATSGVVDVTGVASGTYQVTYTVTADAENCIAGGSYTTNIVVTQSTPAVTLFTYEVEYCNDAALVSPDLAANFTTGGVFSVNNSGLSINTATGEIDLAASVPGTYQITYTYTQQGCVTGGGSSFTVELKNELATEVTGDCKGSEFWLQAYPVNASYDADAVSYIWADANGTEIGTDSVSFNVSEYRKNNPGVSFPAVISVTVVSGRCTVTKEFEVQSMLCDIQKGISPNGDTSNETLDLRGMNVVKVNIFNRYGKEVYKFEGAYTDQWHGQTASDKELPTGTYFYNIVTRDGINKTGWIYINR